MQFLVALVLNSFLGTIAARRCLSQTVPTAGDPWSPEQANNEPTQKNAGHARIFGFPIEPVGSLTICTAYGTPDDSVAPQPLVRQKPIVSHLHPELFVRVRGSFLSGSEVEASGRVSDVFDSPEHCEDYRDMYDMRTKEDVRQKPVEVRRPRRRLPDHLLVPWVNVCPTLSMDTHSAACTLGARFVSMARMTSCSCSTL